MGMFDHWTEEGEGLKIIPLSDSLNAVDKIDINLQLSRADTTHQELINDLQNSNS